MRDLRGIPRQYQKHFLTSTYKLMYVPYFPKGIDLVAQYGTTGLRRPVHRPGDGNGNSRITEDRELQKKFAGVALSMDEFLGPAALGSVWEKRARYRARAQR